MCAARLLLGRLEWPTRCQWKIEDLLSQVMEQGQGGWNRGREGGMEGMRWVGRRANHAQKWGEFGSDSTHQILTPFWTPF